MSSLATSSRALESAVPNAVRALRRILVGSVNSSKIQAVGDALAAFVPDLKVDGVEVESGVPEQPVGFGEILRGAKNRADTSRMRSYGSRARPSGFEGDSSLGSRPRRRLS